MKEIVKLREEKSGQGYTSYAITIPKDFIKELEWKRGDRILVILDVENKRIVLQKA
ncbi:MAG: AbrB/MazE/SpoVT family DNA-binding domain-containing protein [Desulfurococcales archaeon]|nr:AbrB/MazE/SpoVT family DNA-binding domain-containing protein [Desulfurococcales archaeon]